MKKLIIAMALCAIAFTSCTESPRMTAENYISAVQRGDWKTALDYTALDEETKEPIIALMEASTSQSIEQRNQITKFEVLDEQISTDGNSATVKMRIVFGDGHEQEQEIPLVMSEDGRWLIEQVN